MIVLAAIFLLSFGAREIFDFFYARIYGEPKLYRLIMGMVLLALGLVAACIVFLSAVEMFDG